MTAKKLLLIILFSFLALIVIDEWKDKCRNQDLICNGKIVVEAGQVRCLSCGRSYERGSQKRKSLVLAAGGTVAILFVLGMASTIDDFH